MIINIHSWTLVTLYGEEEEEVWELLTFELVLS